MKLKSNISDNSDLVGGTINKVKEIINNILDEKDISQIDGEVFNSKDRSSVERGVTHILVFNNTTIKVCGCKKFYHILFNDDYMVSINQQKYDELVRLINNRHDQLVHTNFETLLNNII